MFEFWSSLGSATLREEVRATLIDLARNSASSDEENQAALEIQYFLASEGINVRMSLLESCLLAHFFQQDGIAELLGDLEEELGSEEERANASEDEGVCAVIALMMVDGTFRSDVVDYATRPHGVRHYLSGRTIHCPLSFDIPASAEPFLVDIAENEKALRHMEKVAKEMWKPGKDPDIAYCPEGVIFLENQIIPCVEPGEFRQFVGRTSKVLQQNKGALIEANVLKALHAALDEVLRDQGLPVSSSAAPGPAKAAPLTHLAVARKRSET